MAKHRPGTYLAKVVDYGISKTQAGLPQVVVCFRYMDENQNKDILWFGSFKDTVVERTVDTLVALGLKDKLEDLAGGIGSGALNPNKEMEIVVEERADLKGVLRTGVAWVNDPSVQRGPQKISREEASQLLSGVNAVLMRKKIMTPETPPFDLLF